MAWGFFAHRLINRKAIYHLPPELFGFYKSNIDYLEHHAVDPDQRRYILEAEAPRHYIDLDRYIQITTCELKNINTCLPVNWNDALEEFSEDTIQAYGVVPWHINLMTIRLQKAFLEQDVEKIMRLSAEIGHYASDAHVPLHTTENYNGQLTGQIGIHALWESRIPEKYAQNYSFIGKKAIYLENVIKAVWDVVVQSHSEVNEVLSKEKELRVSFEEEGIYVSKTKGRSVIKDFSPNYIDAYEKETGTLVAQKMKLSSAFISSIWYTAWVNAGQPDFSQKQVIDLKKDETDGPAWTVDHKR